MKLRDALLYQLKSKRLKLKNRSFSRLTYITSTELYIFMYIYIINESLKH